ncbi:MAG: hypothetical protein ACFFC1_06240 [Promethearchaeota archaeon]
MKYILSDGYEDFEIKDFKTYEELEEAEKKAREATDGNIRWYPLESECDPKIIGKENYL